MPVPREENIVEAKNAGARKRSTCFVTMILCVEKKISQRAPVGRDENSDDGRDLVRVGSIVYVD